MRLSDTHYSEVVFLGDCSRRSDQGMQTSVEELNRESSHPCVLHGDYVERYVHVVQRYVEGN